MDSAVQILVPSLLDHVASHLTLLSPSFPICIMGIPVPASQFMRIHSFIQQTLAWHLLWARHCSRCWGHSGEQDRQNPCSHGAKLLEGRGKR